MDSKKISLAGKEFDVPEMAIGRRKFLVPAIRKFFEVINAKEEKIRFELDESQYDMLIEIVFKAIFPQIKKDDLLNMVIDDDDFFKALFVIVPQCGLKREEQKPGEAKGESQTSPTTTV